jgi:hypothetical protein
VLRQQESRGQVQARLAAVLTVLTVSARIT